MASSSSLSLLDARREPSSLSNPEEARAVHASMRWTIDFEAKKVRGSVEYTVEGPGNEFRVDTSGGLTISKALVDGEEVAMAYGPTSSVFGTPVAVPLSSSSLGTRSSQVKFEYETGEGCTAAQWLDKEQTGSKRYPFFLYPVPGDPCEVAVAVPGRSWGEVYVGRDS
mmetsp:Transcript_27482/g.88764  ORF Transcript_27482/g.88764 Transcript_27482/m.88764 type:complete len:168 (-) Transcript_27482:1019-1522(-)